MATITLAKSATILPDLSKPSYDQLLEIIAQQKADLDAKRTASLTLKISEKGALCIYGLGRFPVTLYISQFDKVAAAWPTILDFVKAHRAEFATKA